ncbi:MAG: [Lachnospiraceae bacterium]|nr:[FeFe] hydrogenase H-cluster maturation GTPase HydF [Lachnospiraceae bacterium]
MSLNTTPSSERIHIGFFGRTNAGKSSLVNAITGQQISLVSEVKGTTTDPIKKAMELLPLGPVVLIDTPGLDDSSELGELREKRTKEIFSRIHMAVLVIDAREGVTEIEMQLEERLKQMHIPYLVVYNKKDLLEVKSGGPETDSIEQDKEEKDNKIYISTLTGENIELLKEKIGSVKLNREEKKLVADLLEPGDHVVLVIPIDKAAPKGRLILPQQQTIRDILDAGCTLSVCQPENMRETLELLRKPPKLVITDSQVFSVVKEMVPSNIMLTSFSILFARYKGNLESTVKGAYQIEELKDGDKILISEGCTHHRQCGDIGTEKLPKWILKYTGKEIDFEFTSGGDFPEKLEEYKLIIHCGACMLNEKQMQERIMLAKEQNIPMTNYGITIAYLNGILQRSIEPFQIL